mgnify:CR=1 FL=1
MGRTRPLAPVLAFVRDQPEMLLQLLQQTPSIARKAHDSYVGTQYPLVFAIRTGAEKSVEILLEHGAPVSYTQHKLLLCDAVVRVPL